MFVPDCWLILTIRVLFADVQGYEAEIGLLIMIITPEKFS